LKCRVNLLNYIDVSCRGSDTFFSGEPEEYFLLWDIKLNTETCSTFIDFLSEKGTTFFDVKYWDKPKSRRKRQVGEFAIPIAIGFGTCLPRKKKNGQYN